MRGGYGCGNGQVRVGVTSGEDRGERRKNKNKNKIIYKIRKIKN